jgi:hypothetical protein
MRNVLLVAYINLIISKIGLSIPLHYIVIYLKSLYMGGSALPPLPPHALLEMIEMKLPHSLLEIAEIGGTTVPPLPPMLF